MKRIYILIAIFFSIFNAKAQVFDTSRIIDSGKGNIGFQPSVFFTDKDDAEFILFMHAGFGLGNNIDLAAKAGVFGDRTFWGVNAEYGISDSFSFKLGAHNYYDFGLDLGLNITVPINSSTNFITGIDSDIVFTHENTIMPVWLPLAIEFELGYNWSFILESEIRLSKVGNYFLGAGLCVDF